jgi:hypothetical protein
MLAESDGKLIAEAEDIGDAERDGRLQLGRLWNERNRRSHELRHGRGQCPRHNAAHTKKGRQVFPAAFHECGFINWDRNEIRYLTTSRGVATYKKSMTPYWRMTVTLFTFISKPEKLTVEIDGGKLRAHPAPTVRYPAFIG